MSAFVKIVEILLAALYIAGAVVYTRDFIKPTDLSEKLCRLVRWLLPAAHLVFFALIIIIYRRNPVGSFPEFLSALSFGLVLIYIHLEMRFSNRSLGPWVLGAAALIMIPASIFSVHREITNELFSTIWFHFHTIFGSLSYAGLLISAILSVMYLVLYRSLKQKMFGVFFEKFMPLRELGESNYVALSRGVMFMTLLIPFGFIMVFDLHDGRVEWDFKYCMFFTAYFVYATGWLLGRFAGWRGNRLAIFSILAMIVLFITVGAGMFLSVMHKWF